MSGLTGVPYILVLERTDAPGENLTAWPVLSEPAEIPVEIPLFDFQMAPSDGSASSEEENPESDTDTPMPPAKETAPPEHVPPSAFLEPQSSTCKPDKPATRTLHSYFTQKQGMPKTSTTASSSKEPPPHEAKKRSGTAMEGDEEKSKRRTSGQHRVGRQQQRDRSDRQQQQDRSDRQQQRDRSDRQDQRDRSDRQDARQRCERKAHEDNAFDKSDPLNDLFTAIMLFKKRYAMKRTGADDCLRDFPDRPVPMPPISCLLKGCEGCWLNSREEFEAHCDQQHGGVQDYRNRVLYLLSKTVFQMPGSLQRAAMQSFAEFQCRSETDWQNFTSSMNAKLQQEGIPRTERWDPRTWVACCVCRLQHWREDMISDYVAGKKCCFKDPPAVAKLLAPQLYNETWPQVATLSELVASSVEVHLPTGSGKTKSYAPGVYKRQLLLHKRRLTKNMCQGDEEALFCQDCHACLTKEKPEMPVLCRPLNNAVRNRHVVLTASPDFVLPFLAFYVALLSLT